MRDAQAPQEARQYDQYRGVAQLVARVVWDHQAAGSRPVTSTKKPRRGRWISILKLILQAKRWFFFFARTIA